VYAVIDGGIESALQALNTAYGDQTNVSCTPLRSFENFAVQVLDAEPDLATLPFKRIASDADEHLFWLTFTISYRGSCSTLRSLLSLGYLSLVGADLLARDAASCKRPLLSGRVSVAVSVRGQTVCPQHGLRQ